MVDENVGAIRRPDYSHIALTCSEAAFSDLRQALENTGATEWSSNRSEGSSFYFCDPDGHKLEIHVGDLGTRLRSMKQTPWAEVEFFPDAERFG